MGVLSGYATKMSFAQRTLYDRLRATGIAEAVARQLAVAIEKRAVALTKGGPGSGRYPAGSTGNSDEAKKASERATGAGGQIEHRAAATAHRRAAVGALSERDAYRHSYHTAMAAYHSAKASETRLPLAKGDDLTVPEGVRAACRRGLALAPEHGGPGLTAGAEARARSMADGGAVSAKQVARMHSFFSRHDSYSKSASPPSPGYVSWLLWGGDAGKRWADAKHASLSKTWLIKAEWNESDHPRDEAGRFGSGPTVGKKSKSTEEQLSAVRAYGNFSYRDINEAAIRYDEGPKKGADKYEKQAREHVEALSQAVHASKIEAETKLYRGMRLPVGAKIGDTLAPHGFSSASTSKAVATGFAKGSNTEGGFQRVVATIVAPKGMPALDMAKSGVQTNKSEKEFIFDHRQSFRIVSDKGVDSKGIRQLVLEPVAAGPVAKANKPLGAAFSHARASGKSQDKKARKRRANAFLRREGYEAIGKTVAATCAAAVRLAKIGPLPAEFTEQAPMRRKKKKKQATDPARVDFTLQSRIIKAAETPWQRLVYSVVYAPDTWDLHGDTMDAETIERAAHEAMRSGIYVNHEHMGDPLGAHVVESYIAPCDLTLAGDGGRTATVRKGTWVMGMKVTDEATWGRVLDGTYRGFSLEGTGVAVPVAA